MYPFACSRLISLLVAVLQPTFSAAFSWHLTAVPEQCSNLSLSIVGSDGQPPYHVLVIPTGPSPLPKDASGNITDVRAVIDHPFDGSSTSASFAINYPASSHFIAVVSDANGFGTGGASGETEVANSGDASCFNASQSWEPLWSYGVGSNSSLIQCQPTRVWWNPNDCQGKASFVGVVPGGEGFRLTYDNVTTDQDQDQNPEVGFAWTPDIRAGTTVVIIASDDRGTGTGGYGEYTVNPANDASCLSDLSPSSTSGVAAGSVETGASSGGQSLASIVGPAVGTPVGLMALIAFIVVLSFCLRQEGRRPRRLQKRVRAASSTGQMSFASRPLSGPGSIATAPNSPSIRYQPDPFPYTGVGTYNEPVYGEPGYAGGIAPGASAVSPSSTLNSGNPIGMSDTSSYAGSWSLSQGTNPGLHQTSRLPNVNPSQRGTAYGSPSVITNTSGPGYPRTGTSGFP